MPGSIAAYVTHSAIWIVVAPGIFVLLMIVFVALLSGETMPGESGRNAKSDPKGGIMGEWRAPERFELPTFWFVAVNSLLILFARPTAAMRSSANCLTAVDRLPFESN